MNSTTNTQLSEIDEGVYYSCSLIPKEGTWSKAKT